MDCFGQSPRNDAVVCFVSLRFTSLSLRDSTCGIVAIYNNEKRKISQ
ncbi:hypothetical protein [Helicobacter rodentium]|nr:hypothetical protein [Helicobacter rodentium]